MRAFASVLSLVVSICTCELVTAREWSDKTGKFQVEAEFVDCEDDVLRLKKQKGGEIVSVPLSRLSKESRQHVLLIRFARNGQFVTGAIDRGDSEHALELLRAHPSFATYSDSVKWTPLHAAARGGLSDVAAYLLELKADASADNKYGGTPLHYACDCKNLIAADEYVKIVDMLITNKADVNALDQDGSTPLYRAMSPPSGVHLEIAKKLLSNGAKVDIQNKIGETALYSAVSASRASEADIHEMVKLLLLHKANPRLTDIHGESPLKLAKKLHLTKVVEEIENHARAK